MLREHFVVGIFEDIDSAKEALKGLLDDGIDKKYISLITKNNEEEVEDIELEKEESDIFSLATKGAIFGGIIGALAGGVFMFIPGFGPIVGAGALASSLAGLLGGAMTGGAIFGLADALIEWGVAEVEAKKYEKMVEDGKILVIVHSSEDENLKAKEILKELGAKEIKVSS